MAAALGDLREQLVFVGGCAVDLLLTDPAAAPARLTYDVDLVARVEVLSDYHALEERISRLGFTRDMAPDAPICRWRYDNLEVDLMPMVSGVLGFANRWYPIAVRTANVVNLPAGVAIRVISAPAFIATKFEAFQDRGRGDVLGSHDLEDIINVLDGRPGIITEIALADPELRQYLTAQCRALLDMRDFRNALPGMVFPDESAGERVRLLALGLEEIAGLDSA
ncbi:MAG TPA: nucleotidyl transferase AbiEii/AbiGii toxin family protein [Rhodocyclaceae bacterium]|nr:nucleotidyl transferase AbiEii/AbiGii toxin family protein [Rhodocyclaceae bacterium]